MSLTSNKVQQLLGIVLCGGKSSRMKQDKGLLKFHDRPQWQEVYHLLKPFCETVVLSLNPQQAIDWGIRDSYVVVEDKEMFEDHGPMTGLLSVIHQFPDRPIFLVACDYPYLRSQDLGQLINNRHQDFEVVCFETRGYPEPLISIFEQSAVEEIQDFYQRGNDSIFKFIQSAKTKLVSCDNLQALTNVNTLEDFDQFKKERT